MAQYQIDTSLTLGEEKNSEIIKWLQANDLLDAKDKVINYKRKITLDFLREIDPIFLNGFIKNDLKLDGMIAFYFSSAVKKLQKESQKKQSPQSVQFVRTVILSNEEGKAIQEIKNKYKDVTGYLDELNKCINSLNHIRKQNENKINEIRANIVKKINERLDELIKISHNEINKQKTKIVSHSNKIESYQSILNESQQKQQQLLNDHDLDDMKRESQILEINKNINNNYNHIMQNKPEFNPIVSVNFDETKMYHFIKLFGGIETVEATHRDQIPQNDKPHPPIFSVKDEIMEFVEIKSEADLECYVEINDMYQSKPPLDSRSNWSPWSQMPPFGAQKHYTLNLNRGTSYELRARYENKYGWSEYSKTVKYTTRSDGCFDGNGDVLMANNTYKKICDLEIGDKVISFPNAVTSIICRVVQNVNDEMEMVKLKNDCWITFEHPVLIRSDDNNDVDIDGCLDKYRNIDRLDSNLISQYGLLWVLPKEIEPITLKYQDKVYNFILDSHHTINVNGNWCCTLGHDYKGSVIQHELWGNSIAIRSCLQSQSATYPDVVLGPTAIFALSN